ncbi:MAG: MerC domain-containing protein [Saprospiraceae bacterium]|nr:MerC domain-containing protein [Saprospiraceae bacterium]
MDKRKTFKADLLGITASLTCAVHCSVLPLAIAYGLLSSSFLTGHGLVEMVFILISVGLAIYTLWGSYQSRHRNVLPLILFGIGLLCIMTGLLNHGSVEIIMATFGGLLIAFSHFINIRLNRRVGNICYS